MGNKDITMSEKELINRYFIAPIESLKRQYELNPNIDTHNVLWNNVICSFNELISNLKIQSDSFK